MEVSLQGVWVADIGDGASCPIHLPGTLDESKIGHKDTGSNQWHPDAELGNENKAFHSDEIATRFTRRFTYEGAAKFTRRIDTGIWNMLSGEIKAGKRIFLDAERARSLRLLIDQKEVRDFIEPSISTGHIFEVTGLINENSELTFISDNSYQGMPRDSILYSSAATDETQTNWNGILGHLRFRTEERAFIQDIRVYPKKDTATVKMKLYADSGYNGKICVNCEALEKNGAEQSVSVQGESTEVVFESLCLKKNVRRWDLEEGSLYALSVSLTGGESKSVTFGIRDFGSDGHGRLEVNGRGIFLRSEANCAAFPETGHPPMTVEEWTDILERYRSYGINCVRFHSHCPPEAAFTAADKLGMLMQPELSHWNPKNAFEAEHSFEYYRTELVQILRMLANHPSFVMLSLGNELHAGEEGHKKMRELLRLARSIDNTRLYTDASNGHYGMIGCENDADFYTSAQFYKHELRGTFANMEGYINRRYPSAQSNYSAAFCELRKEYQKPVFSFEVGQFEVLPDFDELEAFKGVSAPANLRIIQERVRERGLEKVWKRYVEATGELSRIAYREEVEAAMRTPEMSGISLLGLQDFPGQGTALVGMLNSHLQPKPYEFAAPKHFRSFFRDELPLVLLPKYTWENTETLQASVQVANYGKKELCGRLEYKLVQSPRTGRGYSSADSEGFEGCGDNACVAVEGKLSQVTCRTASLTSAGDIVIDFSKLGIQNPVRFNLIVSIDDISNLYPIWVYPHIAPVCPQGIYETEYLDEKAQAVLNAGGKVYLSPPSTKEALPNSIQAQFTTDFWSVGTFAGQEGGMGQLIDDAHPLFENFPTEFHTNWQWWIMASQRAVILPRQCDAIITEMDSYAFLRPMAQLLECKCGNGRLLFSSMGLQNLQQYPEARALLSAIYSYMDSEKFDPKQSLKH